MARGQYEGWDWLQGKRHDRLQRRVESDDLSPEKREKAQGKLDELLEGFSSGNVRGEHEGLDLFRRMAGAQPENPQGFRGEYRGLDAFHRAMGHQPDAPAGSDADVEEMERRRGENRDRLRGAVPNLVDLLPIPGLLKKPAKKAVKKKMGIDDDAGLRALIEQILGERQGIGGLSTPPINPSGEAY